ncbi:MAG: mechanosensitive ion channel family protein [Gemmatimonadales bacterium]
MQGLTVALDVFLLAIPRILGFAVILIVGWILSSLLAKALAALLHAVKFNELAHRSGFAGFVSNMGVRTDSSGAIASLGKWFVRLITLVVAFDMLGLPAVSSVLQQLLLWLPNLVVGLVVLVIGGLAANAVSRLVRGATAQAGFTNPDVLAGVAKVAVWSLAVVVAVNQLGIATTLINTLWIGVVGALALACGLAFGLGGRDRAAQLLDQWGRRAEEASPRFERVARAAGTQARAESVRSSSRQDHDEAWTERSGYDRRRVGRPGRDRRNVGNGAG